MEHFRIVSAHRHLSPVSEEHGAFRKSDLLSTSKGLTKDYINRLYVCEISHIALETVKKKASCV